MTNKRVTIAENDMTKVVSGGPLSNYRAEERILNLQLPDQRGQFFMELLRAWAMVAGKRGDEDSSGRAAMALLSVEEAVARAARITSEAYAEMKERGWLLDINRPDETDE